MQRVGAVGTCIQTRKSAMGIVLMSDTAREICRPESYNNNWARAWDFQQFDILISVDSDEPVQPPLKLRNAKWCSVSSFVNNHRILKRLAKALIRLHVCAGWSEALLVAHTTLLEISCTGSIILCFLVNILGKCYIVDIRKKGIKGDMH